MFGDNYFVRLATIIISRKLFLFYDLAMPLMIDSVQVEAMLFIKISSLKNTVCNCRELAKVIVAEQNHPYSKNPACHVLIIQKACYRKF